MSQERALTEIHRFLSTSDPEVLSISGRWGVGKTFAWDHTLNARKSETPLRRYAYVSVFGLRSLDALKTAIVQSTVSLDGNALEPTVDSFLEHVSSFDGLKRLGEQAGRKGFQILSKGASAVPYVGKLADLLAPGAALLIRNQIICIDDIERAGAGLDVVDILGLVSSLRERRGCKVVLLLNEDGLGRQGEKFREYLEKAVDQAVHFKPTAKESAAAALDTRNALSGRLAEYTVRLGITNIRVIRRIRRFLSFIEATFAGLHDGVTDEVVQTIALLGWCVFEPKQAPALEYVRGYNRFTGLFTRDNRSEEELRTRQLLRGYGFGQFGDLDEIILNGLQDGSFDLGLLEPALLEISQRRSKNEAQSAVAKPWMIYEDSFADNTEELLKAAVEAIEKHGASMGPADASQTLELLRDLGQADEADRLLPIYVQQQDGKSREFFAAHQAGGRRPISDEIITAFQKILAEMPLDKDPAQILINISRNNSWDPANIAFLASVPVDDYVSMLKGLKGSDLNSVITTALRFGKMPPAGQSYDELARRMTEALERIAAETPLNRMRVRSYIGLTDNDPNPEPADAGAEDDSHCDDDDYGSGPNLTLS